MSTYKDLIVWQRSIELVLAVYDLTAHFPNEEKFGLSSQMQRAAVSIPSNISEGKMRGGNTEFNRFVLIALASCAELETQVIICKKLPRTQSLDYTKIETLIEEVMKMLNTLSKTLKANA